MKHLSDIKKIERCEKMLWQNKNNPQSFSPFLYYNEDIYELTKKKYHCENVLMGVVHDGNEKFFDHEEEHDFFMKTRFEYHDLRVSVPFMIKKEDAYNIYFLYASCYPKESEAQMMADTLWVLYHLGVKVKNVKMIHLNAEYVRGSKLNIDKLLLEGDSLFNDKNKIGDTIHSLIKRKYRNLDPILDRIDETLKKTEIKKERTNICTRRNKCAYFDLCFPYPTKDTSILNLVSSSKKFSLLEAGYHDMSELDLDQIEGTRHQYAQLYAAKTNALFFDHYAVKSFFSNVQYPISYLDFEWETYVYPPYEGMKPFDVLTFQYSLHIEEKNKELIHKEYLGRHDCREEFVKQLLKDIPKEGSVMCFNVEGAEKLRLRQLAMQFPKYESELKQIWERMIDLSIPFSTGLIYDKRMAGMYSLKKLVSIFTDYNYADLDISHGMEAVRSYRLLEENEVSDKKEILRELLEYCAMDTYAEYLIYHWVLNTLDVIEN